MLIFLDGDESSDVLMRRSTSGGAVSLRGVAPSTWVQSQFALSSPSSGVEYISSMVDAQQDLRMRFVLRNSGFVACLFLQLYASAEIGKSF